RSAEPEVLGPKRIDRGPEVRDVRGLNRADAGPGIWAGERGREDGPHRPHRGHGDHAASVAAAAPAAPSLEDGPGARVGGQGHDRAAREELRAARATGDSLWSARHGPA